MTVKMMRTLFVHIGTHKTGTTSIQRFLRVHSRELSECGVFVPTSGTPGPHSGHHNIAWELRTDRRYIKERGGFEDLLDELSNSEEEVAIISSEDFEYLSQYPEELARFDGEIEAAGYQARYIVYFRNQADYTLSLHAELLKHGLTEPLSTLVASIEKNGYFVHNNDWYYEFRYDRFIARWEGIVGPKILKQNFDEAVKEFGLLPHFLRLVGASGDLVGRSRDAPMLNRR